MRTLSILALVATAALVAAPSTTAQSISRPKVCPGQVPGVTQEFQKVLLTSKLATCKGMTKVFREYFRGIGNGFNRTVLGYRCQAVRSKSTYICSKSTRRGKATGRTRMVPSSFPEI